MLDFYEYSKKMKNLQFEHDGIKYSIDFCYNEFNEYFNYFPRKGVVITERRTVIFTEARLWNDDNPMLFPDIGVATCQPEDRFVKETGRSLAIRKLAKSLGNQQLASAMLKCYFNRPRGKKNGK